MRSIDLLIVGPAGHRTGGIARYIADQRRALPEVVDARLYDVSTPDGDGWSWFLRSALRSVARMAAFATRRPPDVVHVHSSHRYSFFISSFYVLFAAYVWQRPVVIHVHGSSFDTFLATESPLVSALQRRVFDAAAGVVVLSEYWRTTLRRIVPAEKLDVLPNAVDVSGYSPTFDAEPPHVVFVSNLIERKGVEELLTALERLDRDGFDFRATIAGDGPLRDRVVALAERTPSVEYRGYVTESEKRALLERGSIFVLPSYAEGLPIALLEGMAGGNAVVATAVGSVPETIDDENGLLVEPRDAEALADALERLVDDPETAAAMGRANAELVRSQYSWRANAARLTRLYAGLLDRPDAGRRVELASQ
jgi:glycosyltransferase involved in cell wall biosynthesis